MKIIKGYSDCSIRSLKEPDATKYVSGKRALIIIVGEFAITHDSDNLPIVTTLGSCVTVVLYDKVAKIKGMNHFLLPGVWEQGVSYRYGVNAMEMMMNEMFKLGCKKKNLIAKIAGGSVMFHNFKEKIGERNVEFARLFCKREGIPVLSERVLGDQGRVVMVGSDFKTVVRTFNNSIKEKMIMLEEKASENELVENGLPCEINTIWKGDLNNV